MSEEECFWLRLLSECDGAKLHRGWRLIVLGDDDAEKASLVDRLSEESGVARGNGLQYRQLTVRDEYRENEAKLGVWLLDGDPFYRPLLRFALDASSLPETVALVVASMSRPWDILDAVNSWTRVLREHIEGLDMRPGELEERKRAVLERYREYVEPGLSIYGSLAADNTREIEENLGLELIVVVTRTEEMRALQSEWGYEEEHLDFIQLSLRDFCLRHGASLFYVSRDKNCTDLLLKYVLHRTHAFPFRLPGVLVERDAILVPAGWDTRDKVRFLSDTLPTITPSTPYRDVVFRPARMPNARRDAPQVFAEGDQEFLAGMQFALDRLGTELQDAATRESGSSTTTTTVVQRNVARRMVRGCAPRSPQKKRVDGADTTLSNFFHSLLNRRTSTPSDRPLGMSGQRTYAPRDPQTTSGLAETDEQNHNGGKCRVEMCEEWRTESGQSKFTNTVHLSLDVNRQLPEYFLSNPICSSVDPLDPFSPPPDRDKSPFDAALGTLPEKADGICGTPRCKERLEEGGQNEETSGQHQLTNGETKSSCSAEHSVTNPNL